MFSFTYHFAILDFLFAYNNDLEFY